MAKGKKGAKKINHENHFSTGSFVSKRMSLPKQMNKNSKNNADSFTIDESYYSGEGCMKLLIDSIEDVTKSIANQSKSSKSPHSGSQKKSSSNNLRGLIIND
jgi:hypothetical protein